MLGPLLIPVNCVVEHFENSFSSRIAPKIYKRLKFSGQRSDTSTSEMPLAVLWFGHSRVEIMGADLLFIRRSCY